MTREEAVRKGRKKEPDDPEAWIIKLLESAVVAFNGLPDVVYVDDFRQHVSDAQAIVAARVAQRNST